MDYVIIVVGIGNVQPYFYARWEVSSLSFITDFLIGIITGLLANWLYDIFKKR